MTYEYAYLTPESRFLQPLIRFQLVVGLVFSVAVPVLMRMAFEPDIMLWKSHQMTVVAGLAAHLLGYFAYRRLEGFPGVAATSAVLPTFALAYGLVFLTIFFLRLDYSRSQAAASFILSVGWYFALGIRARNEEPYQLAIVPGGSVDQVRMISGVEWYLLASPSDASLSRVRGVVADLRADLSDVWEKFIADCALAGKPVYHVKQVVESLTGRVAIEHLSENTLGSLTPNQTYAGFKQLVDWVFAFAAAVLLMPLFLIIAVAIRLDGPGPILFRQQRMGYRGVPFTILKFRTMRDKTGKDLRDPIDRSMTRDGDDRITRIGKILRRSRLDELPQIFNILRGEMSWIGPRPEALELSNWYEGQIPFYRYRHIVRPGLSGWAQVNQGHVTSVTDVLEKLFFDFYYIKNVSPWLDLVIVMRTIRIVITGFGSR